MILIDRKKEIEFLNKAYASNKSEFILIYGRRRLGKTHLIKFFADDKEHFYYIARQRDIELEFLEFKEKLSKKFNAFFEGKNFEELFEEIDSKIQFKKLVIIIDEFPYWIAKNKEIVSQFQAIWDEIISKKKIMLIILGSYMSIVENALLSHKSPIYGRKTGQIELSRMPLFSLLKFFPDKEIEEIIKIYGLGDTIPYYLLMLDKNNSFNENLLSLLSQYSPFYTDAETLIREELREYSTYLDILKAVNQGATKLSEIANKSKVDITNISKYLNVLMGIKIIEKEKPITSTAKEKNYLYKLRDNYFKFWLRYIYPYKGEIEEKVNEHIAFIEKDYSNYMGSVFEKFCRNFLRETNIFEFSNVGRWWFKDKEIDLVAINEKNNKILIGECKWKSNINPEVLVKEIENKSNDIIWKNKKREEEYLIFAKSFSKKISSYNNKKVHCFDLNDISKILKKQGENEKDK